jgi:type VI secretion system protein
LTLLVNPPAASENENRMQPTEVNSRRHPRLFHLLYCKPRISSPRISNPAARTARDENRIPHECPWYSFLGIQSLKAEPQMLIFETRERNRTRQLKKLRTLTLAAVLCTGCSLRLQPRLTLAVNISADANQNTPVAFDFVEINDKDLTKDAAKMTASDWFQKRGQIREDYPKPSSISVQSWEWVPGQVVPALQIPMRRAPRAILVFANYSTPGAHRIRIDPKKSAALVFGREDITMEPLAK